MFKSWPDLKKDTITVPKEKKVVSVFLNNVFELVL
jgi:hypothetical protein